MGFENSGAGEGVQMDHASSNRLHVVEGARVTESKMNRLVPSCRTHTAEAANLNPLRCGHGTLTSRRPTSRKSNRE